MKLGSIQQLFKYLLPNRFTRAENLLTIAMSIRQQLASGRALADLSPFEQQFLLASATGNLEKLANRTAIVERAAELSPDIKGLLSAPESTDAHPPDDANAIGTDEDSAYFWDRFWSDAEVVSVAYMREIYARILAGKVGRPESFSLRTLDVIRCLDEYSAKVFRWACQFVIGDAFLPDIFNKIEGVQQPGHTSHMRTLQESGLLGPSGGSLKAPAGPLRFGEWYLNVEKITPETSMLSGMLAVYSLTKAGRELFGIVDIRVGTSQLKVLYDALTRVAFSTEVDKTCHISTSEDGPWQELSAFLKTRTSTSD